MAHFVHNAISIPDQMKKSSKNKRHFWRRSSRWAVDVDYLATLSADDRANMLKFLNEFYDGSIKKGDPAAMHQGNVKCGECSGLGHRPLKRPGKCGPCSEAASKDCANCGGTGIITQFPCNGCGGKGTVLARRDCYRRKNTANRDQYTKLLRDRKKDVTDY